jgi:2,4-dienoyl-CoA reductase-like NADH-dependent reductase (Old Yellow Enzyme family)/thioredoxin reductase
MHKKYPSLLSPLKIGNVVLKNRLSASPSRPPFIQGPEPYPSDALISHYAKKAKAASVVTCTCYSPVPFLPGSHEKKPSLYDYMHKTTKLDSSHNTNLDIYDGQCQHYISQMVDAIHFYGSKASLFIMPDFPRGYDVSAGISSPAVMGERDASEPGLEIPVKMLNEIADDYALQALVAKKDMGFDMAFLHMSYRSLLPARFLSPLTNKRTDEFGGNLENRARFPLMICDRIKKVCGEDFLIEVCISGVDPGADGWTLEETVRFAGLAEGRIDLLQLRSPEMDPQHPTGFNPERTPFLYMAEAVKESGARVAAVAIAGFQDMDNCEEVISSGKADLIAMARGFVCDPEFGRKAYEGRGEDVVPCIRCNKCIISSNADPYVNVCSVNPTWGLGHRVDKMIDPPPGKMKVAVVGGGPAGMEAALVASGRGHDVTLYEKSGALGGQLKHTDNVSFKWPLKNFKNYLIRQIEKSNVKILLNTETTAEILDRMGYDVVLAAIGSEPVIPPIPGVHGGNIFSAIDVYGNEDSLAEDVVIIGGGEVGVETGIHLAGKGHKVILLEMQDRLAPDTAPLHYYSMLMEACNKQKNLSYILNARCTEIGKDKVSYADANGIMHEVKAGSVVVAAGMKPRIDQVMRLSGAGNIFYMIGDCNKAGNVQKVMRSAFGIASMI